MATVGSSVAINGSGFTGATHVYFNGVAAAFAVGSDAQITATVPFGALSGPVEVDTPAGIGTSPTEFKVKPKLGGFVPASGPVGASVSITGSAFTGATEVDFSTTPAPFTIGSYGQITATVPAGATSGKLRVTTAGGTGSSSSTFTVTSPQARLSRSAAPPTGNVDVGGSFFGASELVDVYFDTTDVAVASTDGTGAFSGLTITAPASALPGTHWVSLVGRRTGLSAQKALLVRANWPEFRNDPKHKALNTTENVLSPSTVPGLDIDWTSQATTRSFSSAPAVVNGAVYAGSDDKKLYAFPASCSTPCAPLWASEATGDAVASSPAVANGVVYVGSNDGKLYAYPVSCSSPCAPLWASQATADVGFSSSPAVASGVIYIGMGDGKLYAFAASSSCANPCPPLWASQATGGAVTSSPAAANGVVYVGSQDGKLYAFPASCSSPCAPLWVSGATGSSIFSSPAVANGVVYAGSDDKKLYAFPASCSTPCAPLWASQATGDAVASSPAVANGVVYVGSSDTKLYAFPASCSNPCAPIWSAATGAFIFDSPAVANGVVYVGSGDGKVYTFDLGSPPSTPAKPDPRTLVPDYSLSPWLSFPRG